MEKTKLELLIISIMCVMALFCTIFYSLFFGVILADIGFQYAGYVIGGLMGIIGSAILIKYHDKVKAIASNDVKGSD